MRRFFFFAPLAIVITTIQAQTVVCDTLPIAYDPVTIQFTTSGMSFGDSVITIDVTNTSGTNMAYPQLKLVPITPLPPGMTQNTQWDTFASSWNTGVTMPANCFFDVTMPIPVDYAVTFAVWVTNLTPLLTNDSCLFDLPFTLNLNPGTTGVMDRTKDRDLSVWPVPAMDVLNVQLPPSFAESELTLRGPGGELVCALVVLSGVQSALLNTRSTPPGMYVLSLRSATDEVTRCVIAVVH